MRRIADRPNARPRYARQAPLSWDRVAREQHGIVDTRGFAELGVTPSAIRANVAAGRWQPLLPRVYALSTGSPTREARLVAALLYAGPLAVLSHRTAAEEWGMLPAVDGPVHVTVPYRCSAVSQPGVVVHRSRAYAHIAAPTWPPRTARADTAVDMAVEEPDARAAARCLVGLVTVARIAVPEVERRLLERPPRRYRVALAAALRRIAEGVESVLEEVYATDVEAAHALPPAVRQAPFEVDGRVLWEDAVYDHVGVPLTVRLDGRTHERAEVRFRDRRRDNAAELAGRSRLVFGWHDTRGDPCGVSGEVLSVLRRHGWAGPVLRCPRCS